jgi:FAD/FMN-containing dehydrogenase
MFDEGRFDERVLKELQSIVGAKNATAAKHVRFAYSYDLSFVQPKMPDYVVLVENVEQIQGVMRFANQEKIPVTPYTAGTNIGGLTIPERGGILMDLKRMNRILEIDAESHYAVIEPGVSHAKFANELL